MKFTPEVIAALATLRNAAENDFERHRIDVLERDLTNPPQVEVIDDTHQRFNGTIYYSQPSQKGGHFKIQASLHRDVWTYNHGEIPEGYEIHHVDENLVNNNISNLQCLTRKEHMHYHWQVSKSRYKKHVCDFCGKEFLSNNAYGTSRFCSSKCANHWHYQNATEEMRTCAVCGKNFTVKFRSKDTICCSRSCAATLAWQNRKKTIDGGHEKKCVICGKEFITARGHHSQRTCSRECGHKLRQQTIANRAPESRLVPLCSPPANC